ncbi:MAG TPA: TolC family outer membrane protein [Magnetospirillum sp.]|nr:TolC family outer membrane protein [Magnetospirillum sp.]
MQVGVLGGPIREFLWGMAILKSRKSRFCLLASCTIALATTCSYSAGAQTLVEELQGLVDTHPQIQAKQKGVSSADEGIRAARAGYLPTVRLQGDTGPEYIDSPTRRSVEGDRFYKGRETAGLVVTQRLFDGFATDSQVEAAKVSREISTADLRATRQNALLEGTLSYIDVLRQVRLIQLARDNERKIQEQLNLEDERVQKGSGIASDVLAAKQRLQVAKERRVNFEGNFEAAVAKYTQVFGSAPDVAHLSDPPVPQALIPPQLEEAVRSAQNDNPTLQTAAKTIELTSERQRVAEAGYYPNVDLVGRADYENDKNALLGVRRDWSLLVTATWELFSGFKTEAQIAQASFEHAASKDNQLYASRKVTETVKITWHKLKTARERMALLENASVLAEEVWAAQKKRREAGKATVQDVLDEETRINDARINYTSAYYDMIQHSYELLAAMGKLEVDGIQQVPAAPQQSGARTDITKPRTAQAPEAPARVAAAAPAPVAAVAQEQPAPVPAPVAPYIPVTAAAFGDELPDGSPSAMQARQGRPTDSARN